MDFDPHTLQVIIRRIEQQMRCPQCGKRVPVDFNSLRLVGDSFLLLQLKCETCEAFIVLHASLQGAEQLQAPAALEEKLKNTSSTISLDTSEVDQLQAALAANGGSFAKLFSQYGSQSGSGVPTVE